MVDSAANIGWLTDIIKGALDNVGRTLMYAAWAMWVSLFSPLVAAVLIQLFGVHRRRLSVALAILGLLTSFCCTAWVFSLAIKEPGGLPPLEFAVNWIALPGLTIP